MSKTKKNNDLNYYKLSKDKKKKVKDYFNSLKSFNNINKLLNRIMIEGLLALVCGLILLVFYVTSDSYKTLYLIISILSYLGGISFIISQHILKIRQYKLIMDKFNIR